jgi:DNA helicase-2/ATP-dependent DNA helicase PcrA
MAGSERGSGDGAAKTELTPEQRRIVEWGEGPLVVIAGAGTGKTRVIVERVAHLLDTQPDLPPEAILVLTYNVKAAAELRQRIEKAVTPTTASRLTVTNFHSFCHRILTDNAAEAELPVQPDVLDGIGQYLVLKDLRPRLNLVYHGAWAFSGMVSFIGRAKDELVSPDRFDAFVEAERMAFEDRYGPYADAAARLATNGNLKPAKEVRKDYARQRRDERAGLEPDPTAVEATADREARRTVSGDGRARYRGEFTPEDCLEIDRLAATYVADGAALEVMRLEELARVYRAYQDELANRGALDFGEQIKGVTGLFRRRPNILRRYQRQYRHILVDEFQDANIAQIELIEMLGRAPDRPDNVMVVGDDDQSIYRFRGASFAAFKEFDARFSAPPAHDPTATPPGRPPRLRIEQNFRSVRRVLDRANGLIGNNATRYEPDKRLRTQRPDGPNVQLILCAGPEDEAVAIVEVIRERVGDSKNWGDAAILYRKHKHRDEIVKRLRDEDIPYTVVGGLSLFATPEIRDLEQSLRAIADPEDDVALTRMMTAGPWRLDPLEMLQVTRLHRFDTDQHLLEVIHRMIEVGDDDATPTQAATMAKLRRLLNVITELAPLTHREGPHTIVERFLELTGQVLDLLGTGTKEAHRAVANIGSFMRFAADWQAAHPKGSVQGFVDYLDAYQSAGGELPTSVELSEDVQGVRLMTLYQAKGLEFPHVFIPQLLEGEWPTRDGFNGWFPPELLRERIEGEDLHTEEERRLLYVAMTRAQESLVLTTYGGQAELEKAHSRFVDEILAGAHDQVDQVDRASRWEPAPEATTEAAEAEPDALALARRVMPLPTRQERRMDLRLRAAELVGLIEGTDAADPESAEARADFAAQLARVGESAALGADAARAAGLDPLTFRELAGDSAAGANLLDVVPAPEHFSYSSLNTYDVCPLRFAFAHVYRIPEPDRPAAALTFGSTAHAAFEAFTRERRERRERGEREPTRDDLERLFRERWEPMDFGDRPTEEAYQRRVATLLDNFWDGEVSCLGEALREEERFELVIEDPSGGPPVVIHGSIDRIDRLPSGGIEVIDYKTGNVGSQKGVDESLQLSIYALACRDALGLGTPEKVTLYFTESATRMSTTRTDEQLDAVRADILARTARIRSGDFAATPSADACRWCDYARICASRL